MQRPSCGTEHHRQARVYKDRAAFFWAGVITETTDEVQKGSAVAASKPTADMQFACTDNGEHVGKRAETQHSDTVECGNSRLIAILRVSRSLVTSIRHGSRD